VGFVRLSVINIVDDVPLISRSRQCDQQRGAVGPVIPNILRPSNERPH